MSIVTRARITGVVYLGFFITAILGALIAGVGGPGGLPSDAATSANNILSHQTSYELGVALGLISTALYVAVVGLFYSLLRPVNRTLAVLMAFFGLVGCAVTGFGSVFDFAPLVVLGGKSFLRVFDSQQLQALALLFLYLGAESGRVALAFFGFFQIVWGYLIFRSTFLPRAIGVLIAVAGVGWLSSLLPAQPSLLVTATEVVGFVAEASLMLWLVLAGVNARRWQDVENASSVRSTAA